MSKLVMRLYFAVEFKINVCTILHIGKGIFNISHGIKKHLSIRNTTQQKEQINLQFK